MDPIAEKPDIPPEYGDPSHRLVWTDVERKLESAMVYWFASTRPDGRPHVIPRDGTWLDGGLYYGGSVDTVHHRNVTRNPYVAVHIGDGQEAIIIEGMVQREAPTEDLARRLADASSVKYPYYGQIDPSMYMAGISVLRPRRVLAWTSLTEDATRFRFE